MWLSQSMLFQFLSVAGTGRFGVGIVQKARGRGDEVRGWSSQSKKSLLTE